MVPHLSRALRLVALAAALVAALSSCGSGRPLEVAGPDVAELTDQQVPQLSDPEFGGGGGGGVSLGGEELKDVVAAAPPGLKVTTIQIAPLSKAARDALKFTGFRNGKGPGLITLPVYGVNPDIGMYYLVVPVVNEGTEPVRNLKARADFLDASGIVVWTETQPVTHFPTRLGLNPPSLPNDRSVPPGELGTETTGFGLYYFSGNVGIFTFAVPDTAVAKTIRSWRLTFLVSTT